MDHLHLSDFREMRLKSKEDFDIAFSAVIDTGLDAYLRIFIFRRKRLKYTCRPENFLTVWKYLLIKHKCDYVQAKLLQWDDFR